MACSAVRISVGGVELSTSTYENAKDLIDEVGDDDADPTADEFESYIANGNNTAKTQGIQLPLPTQTEPPTPSPLSAKSSNDTPPPEKPTPKSSLDDWDGVDYDVKLSPNFILRYFTIGYGTGSSRNSERGCMFPHELTDLPGVMDKQTRFHNLQALAQNVLEPIYAKFGPFRINSGIRNENSVKPPGLSQHVKAQAADIQFNSWSYDKYWDNAAWIKDNIPYDQFIFEHSPKTGLVWYHLSFNRDGNRSASTPKKVCTMYQGHYDDGLKRYF